MEKKRNSRKEIFTVRKSGTSNFLQSGSQWAKHLVESSLSGAGALLDSSSSWRLITAGRSGLCSGRKKRLTCSSVLNAFTKTMENEKITRKLHVLILVWYPCLKNLHKNYPNGVLLFCKLPFTEIAMLFKRSFIPLQDKLCTLLNWFEYSTSFVLSGFPLTRDMTLS